MPRRLFQVKEATLKNGLQVRLVPSHEAPVVSLYTFFHVGSRNERPGITGIAHLFEHMMFNGAKRYGPKEFDQALEARGGRSNAYTSNDFTVYHDDFAPEALETVIDLESDRMASLAIAPKMLESEREVVMEERRVRIDNDIPGMMDEELGALMFKAHPYRWPIVGWMADIQSIRREDCAEFFRTYYAPNNATLYICGDIDPEQTLALVRRYYGKIRRGPPPPPVPSAEPEQRGERRAIVRHPAQAPAAMMAWKAPTAKDPACFVLDIIQYAMGVGEAARLTRELVYRKNLAVSVAFDWAWRIDPGVLLIFAELHPGVAVAQVEEIVYEELRRLAREGLTESELAKARNMLRAHMLHELGTNSGRANLLGTFEILLGDWREAEGAPARFETVTNEQVKEAAARFFVPEHRSVVVLEPLPVGGEVAA